MAKRVIYKQKLWTFCVSARQNVKVHCHQIKLMAIIYLMTTFPPELTRVKSILNETREEKWDIAVEKESWELRWKLNQKEVKEENKFECVTNGIQ